MWQPRVMSSAISTVTSGLHAATQQFEQAAREIVATGTIVPQNRSIPAADKTAGNPDPTSFNGGRPADVPLVDSRSRDFLSPLIDLKQAETSYKALIKVMQTLDRVQDATIDMVK